jgi:signal transduction histidine kinase
MALSVPAQGSAVADGVGASDSGAASPLAVGQRLGLLLLVAGVVVVTTLSVRSSLQWIGRPFNGFLVARNRVVLPISQPDWPGLQAGVPTGAQLVAIDGRPASSLTDVLTAAQRAGAHGAPAYTFVDRRGDPVTIRVPVAVFTATDHLNLFALRLVNGIGFLLIGLVVVFLRPRVPAARALFLVALAAGLTLILSAGSHATFRFVAIAALARAALPFALLYFAFCFPAAVSAAASWRVRAALLASTAALTLIDLVTFERQPTRWMAVVDGERVLLWLAMAGTVALVARRSRAAAPAIERERVKIAVLGAAVALAFPLVALAAGRVFGTDLSPSVLPSALWILPAVVGYAIVKRDLFELDVFIRRAASYIALSAAIFAVYVVVVALSSQVFHHLAVASSPWFTLVFCLAVIAVVRPLRDWLQAGVDRVFFRIHYDYAQITESLSHALTRTLDTAEIIAQVQRTVADTMAPVLCRLFLYDSADEQFRAADADEPPLSLDGPTRTALARGRILDTPALLMPGARLPSATALLVPLCFENRVEGVLVLGPKKSGAVYGPGDLDLLRTLANQTATALRNAASYRRVTELLSSLESRVEERTRELQETQAELQASNEKLRELNRMKTQFFSDASHELRTPLTLVLGPLEELRRQQAVIPPAALRLIELAHNNAAALLVLTDTLLDLSRLDAGRMEPEYRSEQMGPLIERTAEPFRWLAEQRGLLLRLHGTEQSAAAWCDRRMVSKILGNLLANALKFTTAGSIDVAVLADAGRVGIQVTDTGPGIAPAELPFIFERYRQAATASRAALSGSGLGLALVRELTELQGGTVDADSAEGHGTTFRVWLPAAAPLRSAPSQAAEIPSVNLTALAASAAATALAPPPAASGPRVATAAPAVLLVDDNPSLLEFLRELLGAEYRTAATTDAKQALALLRAQEFDLILSDVMMPGPDGVALCKTIKHDPRLRHIPLILLTARAALESKLVGLEAGADDYITKPFHPEELKARMSALLRMRQMERELSQSHAELQRAYTQLSNAQAQLVQAEKMASLGTLVAGVAHEINNPVSFVNSSIDLISSSIAELRDVLDRHLARAGGDAPALAALRRDLDYQERIATLQQNAAICRDGAARAARIVSDLRTFCRPGAGRPEPADLHDCLDRSLRLLQGEYRGRVTVHREYGRLPLVTCDAGQMSQVFVNLLANAVQAIEGPGDVFVRTRSADGTVTVEIADTGRGMEPAVLSRIFDPFFTTKEVGKGTGLGLSIVRSLVHAHGGDVIVTSTVGRGTTFTVTLPLHA